ncbi:hypothetical protein AAC387_Pa01g1081 [Persea americana]
MSRCFPYPPPGYEGKSRDEALIESLKREKDKAKKEKKEKKEKKKEKSKSKDHGKSEDKKHGSEERGKDRRSQINQERVDHKKRKHEEIEQVERSSVTEEHGQPAATPSLYDSSDSTQSSAKRKKHDLDAAEAGHNQGSGLRIRLPLLKRKDPDLSCNTEQACHSGRANHLATGPENASKFQPGNTVRACSSRRTDYLVEEPKTACALPRYEELACSSGRVDELVEKTEAPCNNASGSGSRIQKVESQFKELLEIWNPPQLLMDSSDFDNQEWLYERKQQCSRGAKQHKESDNPSSRSSGLWPQACYLPGADVYALPYAIPY